ncbi:MAG: 2,3-bisphosphoglycerate-independent phosphoglycerate mutase [DPANN group archaeon]|nr:2,3-bisphosphoglycerate-independent phosphoglycerate mutase [DPANN group archaeon]
MTKKTFCLIILDGLGLSKKREGNAFTLAKTPTLDNLLKTYPNSRLNTSGKSVGLPKGQMGGSEVGHIHIGSGRIISQELEKINKKIEDNSFFKNKTLLKAITNTKNNKSALHILGLLSDGGVHSHINHLFALLDLCKQNNVKNVYIHAILDGRDTPPTSAKKYIRQLQKKIKETGIGKIATIIGRYYAMDRDNRLDRTDLSYNALTNKIGRFETDPIKTIDNSYKLNETDEFIKPIILDKTNIKKDDSIIFFNFRADRARQITKMFIKHDDFNKPLVCNNFTTFTKYENDLETNVVFAQETVKNTLAETLSKAKMTQLRLAETEKYAHVTYFFSGGQEDTFEGEDRILIPSPKIASYDLQPEMSAKKITDAAIKNIKNAKYDFIIINYANADMVGHTGKLDCAIKAVETLDSKLSEVLKTLKEMNGSALIIADHGNAEKMIDYKTKKPYTSHTLNHVPCIYVGNEKIKLKDGALYNIAPTILELMNIKKPKEMSENSLIQKF